MYEESLFPELQYCSKSKLLVVLQASVSFLLLVIQQNPSSVVCMSYGKKFSRDVCRLLRNTILCIRRYAIMCPCTACFSPSPSPPLKILPGKCRDIDGWEIAATNSAKTTLARATVLLRLTNVTCMNRGWGIQQSASHHAVPM